MQVSKYAQVLAIYRGKDLPISMFLILDISGLRSSTIAENIYTPNEDNGTDEDSDYSVRISKSFRVPNCK